MPRGRMKATGPGEKGLHFRPAIVAHVLWEFARVKLVATEDIECLPARRAVECFSGMDGSPWVVKRGEVR